MLPTSRRSFESRAIFEPPFQHVAETVEVDLPKLLALHGQCGRRQWGTQLMGHHLQQPLLGLQPVDQCFAFLTQHQQLVFELQFARVRLPSSSVGFRLKPRPLTTSSCCQRGTQPRSC